MHAPVVSELVTTDPEVAHALVSGSYGGDHLRVAGSTKGFAYKARRTNLGEIRVDDLLNTLTLQYHLNPLGHLMVVQVLDNHIQVRAAGGQERRLGPGDVYIPGAPDQGYFTRLYGARVRLAAIDLTLLNRVDPDRDLAGYRRLRQGALPRRLADSWIRTSEFLARSVFAPEMAASPLVLGAAGRLLAATALAVFDPVPARQPPHTRTDATAKAVRRAVAFIEANPHRDIGVVDIADAAHVSVRAVQLAFRRHLDTTPMAYARRVRLACAHLDLQRADPAQDTVAAVAARWGFHHFGRFAQSYRATYGHLPRQTLR